MIEFNFETDFKLDNEALLKKWISNVITSESFEVGEVHYIFCDDEFLHKLNVEFLNHDTLTDVISFDYRMGNQINGEIFISIERVQDNAQDFENSFEEELHRVMIHGILHFCGYKDKTDDEEALMRNKENEALSLLLR
ncbi:rRNA maturation RNase YbeY [Aequorivita sediminis]|uniref:rRNA maturation RNase YbeY n=1 Tax=Aequorivita sediminis TaxID=3073653 RepID=UPI0028B10977|nr:rRNA maturation RNase YbeY [Aequorivita sp. F6058]